MFRSTRISPSLTRRGVLFCRRAGFLKTQIAILIFLSFGLWGCQASGELQPELETAKLKSELQSKETESNKSTPISANAPPNSVLDNSQPEQIENEANDCFGEWIISPVEDERFFARFEYKYPMVLNIGPDNVTYSNQYYYGGTHYDAEISCSVPHAWADNTADVIFESCLVSVSFQSPPLFYKVKCKGNELKGSVNRSELLFEFTGLRKE